MIAVLVRGSFANSRHAKDASMAQSRLRVYHGPETQNAPSIDSTDDSRVQVSLGEIFPLLADAVISRRTWLRDFEDEEISISSDLYDVILAYQHCRRPSA